MLPESVVGPTIIPDPGQTSGAWYVRRSGLALGRVTKGFRWLVCALIAINFGRLHDLFWVTQRLPVGKLLLPLCLLALAFQPRLRARIKALRVQQGWMLLLFTFAIMLSVPFSLYKGGSFETFVDFLKASLPFVLILALTALDERDFVMLIRAIVGTGALLGTALLAGLGQSEQGRMSLGSTYDANDIALVGVIVFPFAIWLLSQRGRGDRWLGLAGAASTLALVMTAASRGGMLGLAAVLVLLGIRYRKRLPFRWKLGTVALLAIALAMAPPTFWQRFDTLLRPTEDYNASAETGRKALWMRGIGYFLRDPLTGVGASQFGAAEGAWVVASRGTSEGFKWSTAHSVWIQVLAELGIFGITGFLGLYVPTLLDARRLRRRARARETERLVTLGDALAISVVGFMVCGTFLSMAYSPPAMLLAALGISFSGLSRRSLAHHARAAR